MPSYDQCYYGLGSKNVDKKEAKFDSRTGDHK